MTPHPHDLTPAQRTLYDAMSEASERAFCAGWLIALEWHLWAAMTGEHRGPAKREPGYARAILKDAADELQAVRDAQAAAGGWCVFNGWLSGEQWAAWPDPGSDVV